MLAAGFRDSGFAVLALVVFCFFVGFLWFMRGWA